MKSTHETKAMAAVHEAADYLRACGIGLPRYRLTALPPEGNSPFGGSFVTGFGGTLHFNMGRYPTLFLRRWFAMHELGQHLWDLHRPLRWKAFRQEFGEPPPQDYDQLAGLWDTCWHHGLARMT